MTVQTIDPNDPRYPGGGPSQPAVARPGPHRCLARGLVRPARPPRRSGEQADDAAPAALPDRGTAGTAALATRNCWANCSTKAGSLNFVMSSLMLIAFSCVQRLERDLLRYAQRRRHNRTEGRVAQDLVDRGDRPRPAAEVQRLRQARRRLVQARLPLHLGIAVRDPAPAPSRSGCTDRPLFANRRSAPPTSTAYPSACSPATSYPSCPTAAPSSPGPCSPPGRPARSPSAAPSAPAGCSAGPPASSPSPPPPGTPRCRAPVGLLLRPSRHPSSGSPPPAATPRSGCRPRRASRPHR